MSGGQVDKPLMAQGKATLNEHLLDMEHLRRQVSDDHHLQAEVLGLFRTQCLDALAALSDERDIAHWEFGHRLKGSARAVGAWALAQSAEAFETVSMGGNAALKRALEDTLAEVDAALAVQRPA